MSPPLLYLVDGLHCISSFSAVQEHDNGMRGKQSYGLVVPRWSGVHFPTHVIIFLHRHCYWDLIDSSLTILIITLLRFTTAVLDPHQTRGGRGRGGYGIVPAAPLVHWSIVFIQVGVVPWNMLTPKVIEMCSVARNDGCLCQHALCFSLSKDEHQGKRLLLSHFENIMAVLSPLYGLGRLGAVAACRVSSIFGSQGRKIFGRSTAHRRGQF